MVTRQDDCMWIWIWIGLTCLILRSFCNRDHGMSSAHSGRRASISICRAGAECMEPTYWASTTTYSSARA